MRAGRSQWSIATRIFAAQLIAVVVLSASMTLLLWVDARAAADQDAARLSLTVSTTLAHDPFVRDAVATEDPTAELQPYAVEVMDSAGLDFVTIMDPSGIRFTHRNPDEIGKRFLGTIDEALEGRELTETFTGTLGPSVRAVVPVIEDDEVIAIVSAGVTVSSVASTLVPRIPFIVGAAGLLVILGSAAALVARHNLRLVTGTLRPNELARMAGYYESVLHSVREGLILVDDRRRVVLYNDEAAELLGLPPASASAPPRAIDELGLPDSLAELLTGGGRAIDQSHLAGDRILLVNQEPAAPPGSSPSQATLGTVTTLRDRTELGRLLGELQTVRTLTEALRSQTHEFANRLHTVVSLLELGRTQEAIDFIADEVKLSQSLADDIMGAVGDPALAALLLGKSAQAAERGIELRVQVVGVFAGAGLSTSELVSILGNLIDNAMDAAPTPTGESWVAVTLSTDRAAGLAQFVVADSGEGIDAGDRESIFDRGFSTKDTADRAAGGRGVGLALVREIVERRGGVIELREADGTEFVVRLPLAPGEGA